MAGISTCRRRATGAVALSTMFVKLTCVMVGSTAIIGPPVSGYVTVTIAEVPPTGHQYMFKVLASPAGMANAVKELISMTC